MKTLLLVLLAASLVANIVLGLKSRPASSTSGVTSDALVSTENKSSESYPGPTVSSSTGNGKKGGASVPTAWITPSSEQDLSQLVTRMRTEGYPPDVIRAVITQLLKARFASREPNAGQPYWRHNNQTPEAMATQTAVNNERRLLFEALLGKDALPSAMLDAETRLRRYGPISDDKLDLVAKIERDYNEMSAEAWAKRRGNNIAINSESMQQLQQLMEQEQQADIAAVLTPEELLQYEMRNSRAARTLINNLRNLDITEPEYTLLYEAQKAFNTANPRRTTMDQVAIAQRQVSQLALNEEVRAVLGEKRFYSYLEGADFNYANLAKVLTSYPSVAPAATYKVYQLQNELQAVMAQATRDGRLSAEKTAEVRAVVESYNTRLETLLGPEAAEAYRKQGMGRIFTSFRQNPATTTK